jgi:hypothetical protein
MNIANENVYVYISKLNRYWEIKKTFQISISEA